MISATSSIDNGAACQALPEKWDQTAETYGHKKNKCWWDSCPEEHMTQSVETFMPHEDNLSFVGSLESTAIQATKEHLGISSLNHIRSHQGTSGALSLIRCHVALDENFGTKWSAPLRQRYLSSPLSEWGGAMVESTICKVTASSDLAEGRNQFPSQFFISINLRNA